MELSDDIQALSKQSLDAGLRFLRAEHRFLINDIFLPRASVFGIIDLVAGATRNRLNDRFLPDVLNCDVAIAEYGGHALLLISPECSLVRVPVRADLSNQITYLKLALHEEVMAADATNLDGVKNLFDELGWAQGSAYIIRYPEINDKESKGFSEREKVVTSAAYKVAMMMIDKANKDALVSRKLFLSHKGVDKPLIERIDSALRMIGIDTWLDKYDLKVGTSLVRSVDEAFPSCVGAVFFITQDFADAGVIGAEIDRAIHEQAMRPGGFTIIPLVLAQRGGADALVPASLTKLKWETVDDIDIVPTIIAALPAYLQAEIHYRPLR